MKCDELKVHKAYNRWIDEEMPTPNDDLICNEVYLKDEVDAAIAELKQKLQDQCISCPVKMQEDDVVAELKAKLEGAKNETNYWCNNLKVFAQKKDAEIAELKTDYKESCDRLQTANLIKDEQFAEARHHKYKRCLAMAEMCNARYDEEDAKVNGCGASWEYISKEMKYWERWRWRWLKISEQFKEGV